ncbi:UNVERIFIED_CONTAM: hypothetical protein Slati_2749400 [Sesamum latifolium]|uniref:Uncharacterized protein n=1 Tax=Sesamum latifolium TaxID=2727402 RepID=A0AAW2VYX2_9LAMI
MPTSKGTGQFLDHLPTVLQFGIQPHDLSFQGRDILFQIHHCFSQPRGFILWDRGLPARRRRPSRALRILAHHIHSRTTRSGHNTRLSPMKTRGSDTTSHEAPSAMRGNEHRVASCPQ